MEKFPDFFLNFSEPPMRGESQPAFLFKSFRLDLDERQLLDNEVPIPLTPKAFDVLAVLVERAGHLVEKDELLELVWAGSFVEEANVARIVHTLRKALGEDEDGDKFIETVAKKGYRFVADVRRSGAITPFPGSKRRPQLTRSGAHAVVSLAEWRTLVERLDAQGEPTDEVDPMPVEDRSHIHQQHAGRLKSSKLRYLMIAAVVLAAVLLGSIVISSYLSGSGTTDSRSIVVLPVKSINSADRDEIYEIGIADALILKLSSMKGFVVRPLSAIRRYADDATDPVAAGKEQNVEYVLASNFQLADGKIRITAQLVEVASGQIVETYKIEKDAADAFAMQDAVSNDMGNFLAARFAVTSAGPVSKRGTSNETAYRLYLQGMYLYGKRTQQASKRAVELLEQAVRLDPDYALAWAGKAHAHRFAGNLGRDTDTHEEYRRSMEAVREALARDKDVSEAYSALCENKYYYEFDFAGAEVECRRAVSLDPNSSRAHEIYGRYLYHRGRFDEGIRHMKTAVDLEPTSLFNQRNLGIAFYYAGRYAEAEAQFKRVIEMDENFASAYMWLRNALEMQKNDTQAFEWLIRAQRVLGADQQTIQLYQTAYRTSGYPGVLREHARFHEAYNQYYVSAVLHTQIGEKDKALEFLERSYEKREWGMNSLLLEPHLQPLRSDPRFMAIVERVGLN